MTHRRKRRSARPRATANLAENVHKTATSTATSKPSPVANTESGHKSRRGFVDAESIEALLPWRNSKGGSK
jgi:hypothetical protein